MLNKNTDYSIEIGSLLGYGMFVYGLEEADMGNIIFRNGKFTPSNILHYMKHPFTSTTLWYPSLWKQNWLIMTVSGAAIGYTVIKLFNKQNTQ